MATKRAFNILEQRNVNENTHIGKTPSLGKNATRAPFKSALKDLTNSSNTARSNLNGKLPSDGANVLKKPLQQLKPTASSVSRKKSSESNCSRPAEGNKKQNSTVPTFPVFSPLDAEYSWGKEACLREDLLEQMIEYNGVSYKREIKPMKPLKIEPIDLPELEMPRQESIKAAKPAVPNGLPTGLLFNLQEVDIPDLEFFF